MKSKNFYIGIVIGFSFVLVCTGIYVYQQAQRDDIKSIVYLNALQEEELVKADFAAFEKIINSVEEKGELVDKPETRYGSCNYRMTYRNGRERNITVNGIYCYIDGKCYVSSKKLYDQFAAFFER